MRPGTLGDEVRSFPAQLCGLPERAGGATAASLRWRRPRRRSDRGQYVDENGHHRGDGDRSAARRLRASCRRRRLAARPTLPSPWVDGGAVFAVSWAEPLCCSHCAGIIGAYEPLIVRVDGSDRESSLAAEPALPLAGAEHLHAACARKSRRAAASPAA